MTDGGGGEGKAGGGGSSEGPKLKYPRGAFFILVGYLLERFVYYGLFGGAVFYMQRMLGFTSSSAKTVKAIMEGLIYLAPIAGAILADTYLGKVMYACVFLFIYFFMEVVIVIIIILFILGFFLY